MKNDTRELLKECDAGCKMAIDSMEQVEKYIKDDELRKLIEKEKKIHRNLEKEASECLENAGEGEKDPPMMASAFSWITTEAKLMMKDDHKQIAKIMMDGCNMGIQSITEYKHKYQQADGKAIDLAERLVDTEEKFRQKLKKFL